MEIPSLVQVQDFRQIVDHSDGRNTVAEALSEAAEAKPKSPQVIEVADSPQPRKLPKFSTAAEAKPKPPPVIEIVDLLSKLLIHCRSSPLTPKSPRFSVAEAAGVLIEDLHSCCPGVPVVTTPKFVAT